MTALRALGLALALAGLASGCSKTSAASAATASSGARLPIALVSDIPLPGGATRFDYQDIDAPRGHLVVAHMNDGSVLIVDLASGAVLKELSGIPTARGVVVAPELGRIFVTSSPNQLVIIDAVAMTVLGRATTGTAPDGVGWDPVDQIVGVSDQHDGALSLLAGAGTGPHTQVPLGAETGNVVFDPSRSVFWITVVNKAPPDQLVAVSPTNPRVTARIDLPGCSGAHGLRLHPDGQSALVACEGNSTLARVDLAGAHAVTTAPTGADPDVLAIDPGLALLYVAAESGDLTVFDLARPGLALVGHDSPGPNSHTVTVDPATHRVFFPLMVGPAGKPILRIMRPGT